MGGWCRWFEQEGVALKVEADGRVFPVTDDSGTIIEALRGAAEKAGVQVRTGCKARYHLPTTHLRADLPTPPLAPIHAFRQHRLAARVIQPTT